MWVCSGQMRQGLVLEAKSWALAVRDGKLHLHGVADEPFDYDIEDARVAGMHTIGVIAQPTTRIFLDGYEVWSATAPLRGTPTARQGELHTVSVPGGLGPDEVATFVRDLTSPPTPLVSFASMRLSDDDARAMGALPELVIHAKFRVRGPGQYGTILAAGLEGATVLTAYIDGTRGITLTSETTTAFSEGNWSDGRWHHLALAFTGGAIQIWIDGWLHAHVPGSAPRFDNVAIGQDLAGHRLMGEVGEGGIYGPINDQQIALLAHRAALSQVPVFDSYPTGSFHRIPALTRTSAGTLLAFADRRRDLPNDAPNATDLVLRRSFDEGRTWEPVQTVASFPGEGIDGVAVTDAAAVEDRNGRIHILADFYAAHTGLLNSRPGSGMDERGVLLEDADGTEYAVPGRWPASPTVVVDSEGAQTPWLVDADGSLTKDGEAAGNVLIDGELLLVKTAHIGVWTSDDDGATWSPMRLITDQIKDSWMTFLGIGPGNGIRLEHGEHAGRLLVPCYFSTEDGTEHSAAALISDDDGATWYRGSSPNDDREVDGVRVDPRTFTDSALTMTESAIVEVGSRVHMFSRSQHPRVLRTYSDDGGTTWSEVVEDPQLREIFCQPAATLADDGSLVFANASRMLPYRGCGTVYRANGVGEHWVGRAVNPRHHGYQSLAALPGGDVAMLWERETAGIWMTRVPAAIFSVD